MKLFKKKPIPVEVVQFKNTPESIAELQMWMGDSFGKHRNTELSIKTLEDGIAMTVRHIASDGDYILKGIQGEFWAVKPEIFEATYEEVK
jgi:hypothetical protein